MAINDKFKMVSFSSTKPQALLGLMTEEGEEAWEHRAVRSRVSKAGNLVPRGWKHQAVSLGWFCDHPSSHLCWVPEGLSTGCSAPGSYLGPTEGPLSSGSLGGRGKGRGRHGAWGLGTLWWGCPVCPLGGPQAGSRLWTPYLLAFCQPISLEVSHLASPGWGPTARPFLIHSLPSHVPRKSGNRSRGLLQKKLLST